MCWFHCQFRRSERTNWRTGTHISGYNNSLVTYLEISLQSERVTKNIERYFPNLKFINFRSSLFTELSPDDFKPFPGLIYLDVASNKKIIEVDSDLFYYTPNLKFVCLANNAIQRAGFGLLSELKHLEHAHFTGNSCTTIQAKNSSAVLLAIESLSNNCPASLRMVERVTNRMQKRIGSGGGGSSLDEQRVAEIVHDKTEEMRVEIENLNEIKRENEERIVALEMNVRELNVSPCTCRPTSL